METSLFTHYRAIFNNIAHTHLVPDIIPEKAKFLFILESPHIQELKFGAPVSGSSGTSMTQHLFPSIQKLPLGQLLLTEQERATMNPAIELVALMNACQIPLQKTAYQGSPITEKFSVELGYFEEIRVANQKRSFANDHLETIQQVIANSLRKKLFSLTDRQLYVIPCGKFAQKFAALANVTSPNWEWIDGIPHPSYNNWSKADYQLAVNKLTSIFYANAP